MKKSDTQALTNRTEATQRTRPLDPFVDRLRQTMAGLEHLETHLCVDLVSLGLQHYEDCPPSQYRARLLSADLPKTRASEIKVILDNQKLAAEFVAGQHSVLAALKLARASRKERRGEPETPAADPVVPADAAADATYQAFTQLLACLGADRSWVLSCGPIRLEFTPAAITPS
jgi:hypothetical protein